MTIWKNLYTETNHGYVEWWLVYGDSYGTLVEPNTTESSYKAGWVERTPVSLEVGKFGRSFGYDFYNHIHITPNKINFNNLVGVQSYSLKVWSAFYYDRRLEAIDLNNGEGISLTNGQSAPFNFSPSEEVIWTVTGTQDGPPVVAADVTLDFDRGELFTVPITGRRVISWTWLPDWSAGVVERLEWSTDVMESYNGTEQRRSLRLYPRRVMEFTPFAMDTDRRLLESTLFGWGPKPFAVPVWPDVVKLTSTLLVDSYSIPINTVGRSFNIGAFALIHNPSLNDNEIVEVESIATNSLTLKRATVKEWPVGTDIYPAHSMYLKQQPTLTRGTRYASFGRTVFETENPSVWATDHGMTTYRGYPVYEFRPNWVKDPEFRFDRKVALFDSGTGLIHRDEEATIAFPYYTMDYTPQGRSQINTWRKAMQALKGRFGSMWVSTDASDFKMVAPLLNSEVEIDVAAMGFNTFVAGQVGRKDVRIELTNGSVYYRRIINYAVVDETTERITLDSVLGVDVYPQDMVSISFMFLARLDTDVVELAWWNGDVVNSTLTFKGFKNDV